MGDCELKLPHTKHTHWLSDRAFYFTVLAPTAPEKHGVCDGQGQPDPEARSGVTSTIKLDSEPLTVTGSVTSSPAAFQAISFC